MVTAALFGCTPKDEILEPVTQGNLTVIQNTSTIDGITGLTQFQDVLIENGKIVFVGEVGTVPEELLFKRKVETLDGTNKYLIPGLWDAHVHLTYTSGLDHETFFPLSIAHGVTSLRDIGGHLEQLADAREAAKIDPFSPSLYVSGPLIDGPMRVYDGRSGASLHEELFMLVDAGLSPQETLKAATYTPAEFFGIEDEVGTIQSGMTADLVLLNANPLEDIHAVADIAWVIKQGKLIDRNKLDELKERPFQLVR